MRFEYDAYIHQSMMELRVEPQTTAHQSLRSFYLAVGPPTRVFRYVDWNGNAVHHFGISDYHDRIEAIARSLVVTHPAHPEFASLREPPPEASGAGPLADFVAFGGPVARSEPLERLARELAAPPDAPIGAQVQAMGELLARRFRYRTGVTDYRSTSDHILEEGAGVCQDYAHLALGLLRLRGIPCRYVSGYLHVESGSEEPSQSHAWVEVHAGGGEWVAFDPTHARLVDEQYVSVAHGRHYDDVPPNRGIFRGAATESMRAEVHTEGAAEGEVAGLRSELGQIDVPVFREAPRPTRPDAAPPDPQDPQQQQQQ